MKDKLLLIGWDAADWKVITPLVDAGKMPNLRYLIEHGVMGNLATIQPALSPMLWTSIATGKRPFKHGVLGFAEPEPQGVGIRPITNLSRKTKALWNILNQNGFRTNVVGWWPSHPAEPVNGAMVSNHFQQAVGPPDKPWPMRPGTVHPPHLAGQLAELRVHPWELDGESLRLFIPDAAKIDQQSDGRLMSCAKIIAECSGVHATATELMTTTEWDFMAVYYDAIDHFGHGFMRYHPPKQDWVPQEDFQLYKNVVESGYRYHDMMLGALLQLAGKDTTVMLISDHGFHPDHLRPQSVPNEPSGPAAEHRPFGIFAAMGPGIREDQLVFGASILDVCPTILTRFGLPVGEDFDGRPLTTAFKDEPDVKRVLSWDTIDGNHSPGLHPPDMRLDPVESKAAIDQLVALGYIEPPDEDKTKAVRETVRELRYNLARAYIDANKHQEAADILRELWEQWPDESRFGVHLFQSFLALEQPAEARTTLDQIRVNKQQYGQKAAEALKTLQAEILEEQADSQNSRAEKRKIDFSKLDRKTQHKIRTLGRKAQVNPHAFLFLEGSLLQEEGRHEQALDCFGKAMEGPIHHRPSLYSKMGESHLALKQWDTAEQQFAAILRIDPINPQARLGLARAHLARGRNLEAAQEALASAGQLYYNPRAHYLAGIALFRCGDVDRAIECLETSVAQNPVSPGAHRRLARIYQNRIGDLHKAAGHRRLARESIQRIRDWRAGKEPEKAREAPPKPLARSQPSFDLAAPLLVPIDETIIVVSGLPRSGTSMMMQMLSAGGLPILTDNTREADPSNPRGYYEFEKVKRLGLEDNAWLIDARGKAVKIIAQLLPRLPLAIVRTEAPEETPCHYRILMMIRPLEEIVASQDKMLARLGKKGKGNHLSGARLADTFQTQLNQIDRFFRAGRTRAGAARGSIVVQELSYHEALAHPLSVACQVNRFLGGSLDEAKMAAAIEPSLHHERL